MPIRHYLQGHFDLQGHRFDADTARLLGVAFEMALVALQHADRVVSPTRDAIAQKIIELARLVNVTRGGCATRPWRCASKLSSPTPILLPLPASPQAQPGS